MENKHKKILLSTRLLLGSIIVYLTAIIVAMLPLKYDITALKYIIIIIIYITVCILSLLAIINIIIEFKKLKHSSSLVIKLFIASFFTMTSLFGIAITID